MTYEGLRVVALSPHQDDVALSSTQTLLSLKAAGRLSSLELVSCFTRSEYTAFPDLYPPSQVSSIRRQEDAAFLERIGFPASSLRCLEQLDSPLRPEWRPGSDIHDPTLYSRIDPREIATYSTQLSPLLLPMRDPEALFLCPLGMTHKDHVITRRAACQAWRGHCMVFYADTPYVFQLSDIALRRLLRDVECELDEPLERLRPSTPLKTSEWLSHVMVYASQFNVPQLQEMARMLADRSGECLWVNRRARQLLQNLAVIPDVLAVAGS